MSEALQRAGLRLGALLTPNVCISQSTPADPAKLARAREELLKIDGIEAVFTRADIEAGRAPRAYARSYVAERSGDLYLQLRAGYTTRERGFTHGSNHAYDTDVPLVLWGSGICADRAKAATTPAAPVDPRRIAPTIAELLGASPPERCRAAALRRVLCAPPHGESASR